MKDMNWSAFAQFPRIKIIDEINRLSGKQQDMLLNLADRGVSKYLNHTLITQKSTLFATANYEDIGNTELILPLRDRFDVSTEMHQLGPLERLLLSTPRDMSSIQDEQISDRIGTVLHEKSPYNDKIKKLDEIAGEFRERLNSKFGEITMSYKDLEKVRSYINDIPLSYDSKIFLILVHSELANPYGKERIFGKKSEDLSHYSKTEYAFNKVENDVSNRFTQSLMLYSRAYAWFKGDSSVEPKHIGSMLPYTLAHRVNFINLADQGELSNLEYAKVISNEIIGRYNLNPQLYEEAYQAFLSSINEKNPAGAFERESKKFSAISDSPFISALERALKEN